MRIKDQWNEQRIYSSRTFAALLVMGLLSFALFGRLVYLQIVRHDYYFELSQGNRVRQDPIPASRGLILDRRGRVLVDNEPAFQLELIPEQTPDLNDALQRLSTLGLVNREDIEPLKRMIRSRRSFDSVPIRLRLSDEEIGRFAVHRYEFEGVELRARQTRHYPYGELGVHALGYVAAVSEDDLDRIDKPGYAGTTLIGKLGVEAAYETQLHGLNGYQQILVNAQGRSVKFQGAYQPDLRAEAPVAGRDLVLAIDLPTQQAAEEALGDRRGAIVALDPANGDVLALVSHPGFDPSLFSRGLTRSEYSLLTSNEDKPLLNRALRGAYPSGSTIKPMMALAGLTYKVVDPERREFCAGVFHLPGSSHLYREGKGGKHGAVNLVDAVARSCDVYFYGLASQLGVDRIAAFAAQFGIGSLTGIDISGEKPGLLPTPAWKKQAFKRPQDQIWFPGETVNFGVGQGYLLVTPLQLAHMAAELAERGRSFQPRLVMGTREANGTIVRSAPIAQRGASGISDEDWALVLRGMIGATTYGTAAAIFKDARYSAAGKTGTAQVFTVAQNARYNEKTVAERLRDHAWFIAFAPADAPRIAVCVLVENGGFGASAAAPLARRVMDAYLLAGPADAAPAPTAAPTAAPTVAPVAAPTAAPAAAPSGVHRP
ncbi:MAG TPA: penicillin-binding protein 2 [Steroidobacteraceae bacterium]|nr:penicillin-binding protein 2 [Steroidobacteraceae bacterium]